MNEEKAIVKFDPASGFNFTDIDSMFRAAECFIQSRLAPPSFDTPQKLIIAWASAAELGIKPFQAIRGMSVVNGRMGMMTDLELSKVRTSGLLLESPRVVYSGEGDNHTCTVTLHRKGDKEPRSFSYSIKQAKQAGLLRNDNWTKYPERMLYHRAIGFGLNDVFTDVLYGMRTVEELADYSPLEEEGTSFKDDEAKVASNQAHEYKLKQEGVKFVPRSQSQGKQPSPQEATEPYFPEDKGKAPAQEPRGGGKPPFSQKLEAEYVPPPVVVQETENEEKAPQTPPEPVEAKTEEDDIDMTPVPPAPEPSEPPAPPARPEWMDHQIRSIKHPRFFGKRISELAPADLAKIETQWIPKVQNDLANASADQELELKLFYSAIAHRNATSPL